MFRFPRKARRILFAMSFALVATFGTMIVHAQDSATYLGFQLDSALAAAAKQAGIVGLLWSVT